MDKRGWYWIRGLATVALLAQCGGACAPTGYLKADDLDNVGLGPAGCIKSCEDLGMRMAALVLVGRSMPGCVCQPLNVQTGTPQPRPSAAPAATPAPIEGAAASTTGYVVLAAAAAARQQEEQQRRQRQKD